VSLIERMPTGPTSSRHVLRFLPMITTILLWWLSTKARGSGQLSNFTYHEMIAYFCSCT